MATAQMNEMKMDLKKKMGRSLKQMDEVEQAETFERLVARSMPHLVLMACGAQA